MTTSSPPLTGKTILLTRPYGQSEESRPLFEGAGATVLIQPVISILPPADWSAVDSALDNLTRFDRIVFSSANGVRFFLDRLSERDAIDHGTRGGLLASIPLAAIGPGTAEALRNRGYEAGIVPDDHKAEGMVEALSEEARSGRSFLSIRADRGRTVLRDGLTALGGLFTEIAVYRSVDLTEPTPEIYQKMADGKIDFTTVTSSAIAEGLLRLFGETLKKTHLVAISPLTATPLQSAGHSVLIPSETSMSGILHAIL